MNEMYGCLLENALIELKDDNLKLAKQLKRLKRRVFVGELVMISGLWYLLAVGYAAYEEAKTAYADAGYVYEKMKKADDVAE